MTLTVIGCNILYWFFNLIQISLLAVLISSLVTVNMNISIFHIFLLCSLNGLKSTLKIFTINENANYITSSSVLLIIVFSVVNYFQLYNQEKMQRKFYMTKKSIKILR